MTFLHGGIVMKMKNEDEQTHYDDDNGDDDDDNGDEGNVKVGGAPCSGGEAVEAPSQQ